uniref:NTF2 domain-containing protein n=2 Tax=Euplotes harpa TaxID=151035 RepID=A0A7S3J6U0_9SPIT
MAQSRADLADLYTDDSMLTYEGEPIKGVESIMAKLGSLPEIRHQVTTFDAQPSVNDGILCMIGGDLFIDGSDNPVKFAQTFHLQKGGKFEYYCLNDVFRLNYG